MIEIVVSSRSFRCTPLAKRHKISITRGRSPSLSQERMQEPITHPLQYEMFSTRTLRMKVYKEFKFPLPLLNLDAML